MMQKPLSHHLVLFDYYLILFDNNYLFKVNDGNTRTVSEIQSAKYNQLNQINLVNDVVLVFIVTFEQISRTFLEFSFMTFEQVKSGSN